MAACNVTQNEIGGKDLIIKKCQNKSVSSTSASDTWTFSAVHGLAVGDVVRPLTIGTNTVIAVNGFYIVSAVPSTTTIKIKSTVAGTALTADDTEAAMSWDVFKDVGGGRSRTFSFASEGIDITNQDSSEWHTILNSAGIRSVSVSIEGVYTNEAIFQEILAAGYANELTCLMFLEKKTYRLWEGCYKITAQELTGPYDAEGGFSISAESSGQVVTQLLG